MWPISASSCLLGHYYQWAEVDPAWSALVEGERTVSYGGLAARVADGGHHLRQAGAAPGSRLVVATAREDAEWVVALLAVIEAGGQAVLPDPAWTAAERRTALEALDPVGSIESLSSSPSFGARPGGSREAEAGMWLFTSGTTARPKPRFRSVEATAAMLQRLQDRLPPAVAAGRPASLCVAPLHHGFGLLNALLLGHRLGGTVHLAPADDPDVASRLIQEHDIGFLFAWPAQFESLAERGMWRREATSLRWCVSSSRGLARGVAERFEARTGCPVRQQYGTTETGPLTVDSDERPDPACVGTALDGVELRVVDDKGDEQPPGEEGRVAVGSNDSFSSQLEREADGLYYPGDLGRMDAAGRLYLTARYRPFYDERAAPLGSGP